MKTAGRRIIKVSPELIRELLLGEIQQAYSDAPMDLKVINVKMDFTMRVIEVLCESMQWAPVPNGQEIPWFEPTFTTVH